MRKMSVLYSNTSSGFEVVHGILDLVMQKVGIKNDPENGYVIKESEEKPFFPGRQAHVLYKGR
jgi:phenylalanyl-tRNA synthetase beta chain